MQNLEILRGACFELVEGFSMTFGSFLDGSWWLA
jgi:hypothetical protein